MLKIIDFSKKYKGGNLAVDHINLEVARGEIFGFIGHNGAGKTTTIKSIVGILEIQDGQILVDGISVKENTIKTKEMIAYIPDNPDIYESLTGIQYLNFIADIYKVDQQKRNELIQHYANLFTLTDALGDVIGSYSHGMKQKLVIISALIHEPKLLILDEPFVGLDPKAAHILKTIMRDFCNEGKSIFFSTHVLEVAEKLCDRVAIIKEGKIVKTGKMSDVLGDSSLESVFLELVDNG